MLITGRPCHRISLQPLESGHRTGLVSCPAPFVLLELAMLPAYFNHDFVLQAGLEASRIVDDMRLVVSSSIPSLSIKCTGIFKCEFKRVFHARS